MIEYVCCMGRSKSSERKEYEQLRDALAKKQEEVRRLQAQVSRRAPRASTRHAAHNDTMTQRAPAYRCHPQVAKLDSRPISAPMRVGPADDPDEEFEDAAIKIQSVHRGHLSRRVYEDDGYDDAIGQGR
eukprot:2674305-Prymnesium_polylepis.2